MELEGEQVQSGTMVLLPFMAQGHIIPFLSFAFLLGEHTPDAVDITIVNTPANIRRLRSSLPPKATKIYFAELPFEPSDHGLPPAAENTDSISPQFFLRLIQSAESLHPAFHRLLSDLRVEGRPPLCVISDEFMTWSVKSAGSFGIPHIVFNTSGAYGTAIFASVWSHLPLTKGKRSANAGEDPEISLPDFPETTIRLSQLSEACRNSDGSDPWVTLFRKQISLSEESDGLLVNTVEGIEKKGLQQVRRKVRHGRVWAIGPLHLIRSPPPPPSEGCRVENPCIEWLDQHPPDSVLYVCFGSQSPLNPSQMMELANGLESSGCRFIWVIKPPTGFDRKEEFRREWLPEGFEDRISRKKQGFLVKEWAPQLQILGHESTGGFLSHCGWNSVLEALSCGVPIIGWPMSAEQPFNSKLLEDELGVGIELARWSRAEIRSADVARVVRELMDGEASSEKGRNLRREAKEIAEVARAAVAEGEGRKGSSVRAFQEFIQFALSKKMK